MEILKSKKQESEFAVELEHISKSFIVSHEVANSVKELFNNPFKKKMEHEKYTALKDINIKVKKGEILGIIGRNGSGKSTLLKIVVGIYAPDDGKIKIRGRIVPFLELGVGFNMDLTARENIYLNGTILGMTRPEIEARFNEIVQFAEIEEFLDTQVKKFSSGMLVRLAFSIAIQAEGDIYILDEVLAVGDVKFQGKSKTEMFKFRDKGKTVIFVSHNMAAIQEFCDRVVCIEDGNLIEESTKEATIQRYLELNK